MLNLSNSTFYDKNYYDEASCKKIEFIKCMRNVGVEIEILIEYMQLLSQGRSTVEARKKLLEEQRENSKKNKRTQEKR